MSPGSLLERLRDHPTGRPIPHLEEGFDANDDLHLDGAAEVLLAQFHETNDAASLSLLFELAHPRMLVIARQVTNRFALALDPEDLVMGFMTRLFTDVRRPQPAVRRFLGLAYTSMRNDALNQLRTHTRVSRREERYTAGLRGPDDPAVTVDHRERGERLERVARVTLGIVNQCFHTLKERDRAVLLAREVGGLSYDEVAATLSLPPNQVGTILKRARARLADRIGRALASWGGEAGP